MELLALWKAASLLMSSFLKTILATLSGNFVGAVLLLAFMTGLSKLLSTAADLVRAWKGGEK